MFPCVRSRTLAVLLLCACCACLAASGCGADPDEASGEVDDQGLASVVVSEPGDVSGGGDSGTGLLGGPIGQVLIISVDTLRADRLQPYGYGRPTSDNLASFASQSVVFELARAQAPQTAPSHASLFCSEYPGVHGIINAHGAHPTVTVLPEGLTTLAQAVSAAGVETAAFVSGGNLTRRMGMDRGFDTWDESLSDVSERIDSVLRWMLAPERGRFLALVHTYQVHAPYLPPRELVREFTDPGYDGPLRARTESYLNMSVQEAWEAAVGPAYWEGMLDYNAEDVAFLSDLYDGEVRHVDSEIRRLLEYVNGSDLRDRLAIVILSDHGEEFRDHGKFQHDQVFEELMHVPLMFRLPRAWQRQGMTGRVPVPVALVDVAPTVADLMGVSWIDLGWAGRSLLPLLEHPASAARDWAERPIFGELVVDPGPKFHHSVVWHGWKYIHIWQSNIDHTWEHLYDLRSDPGERRNRIDDPDPEARKALEALKSLAAVQANRNRVRAERLDGGAEIEMDAAMLEDMRRLGYVDLDSDVDVGSESDR